MKKITLPDFEKSPVKNKRWLGLLSCCLFLFASLITHAQTMGTIQIGSGTGTTASGSTTIPVTNYVYSYTQHIVTAAEYGSGGGAVGNITKIRFKATALGTVSVWNNWTVYIGNTTKTEFTSNTDFIPVANLSQVFNGIITPVANEWFEITFTTPFNYTGDNIVIAVDENTLLWTSAPTFSTYTSTANSGIIARSDSDDQIPTNALTATGRTAVLPQMQFEGTLATCMVATGVTTVPSSNGVEITWSATPNASSFNWIVVDNNAGTSATPIASGNTTQNTASANGLTPITPYHLYIKTDCGTEGLSVWAGPYSFKTTCVPVTDFYQNFDTVVTGTTAPMPDCWSKLGNGTTYPTTGSIAPNSPANRLYMFANGTATTPTEGFAIMPAVSNLQANTHRLKFKAYASTTNKTMEIGYFIDVLDITSFVTLETIQLPGTQATTQEFTIEPSGIPAGVSNLVFRNNAPTASTTLYIDDVAWEQLPLCDDIISIQTQTFNSTTATITWGQAGAELGWEYVYEVSTVTDPNTLTPVAVTGNPMAMLTQLTQNTTYKIWIRSNCGPGALGNWQQNPHTFTTSCTPVTTFDENFDSYTATGASNPLPNCWSRNVNTGSSYITTGSAAPLTPPNRLYLSASATTSTNGVAVMPAVSNLQAETHRLRFKGYCTTAGKSIEIGYFELAGDASSFIVLETFEMPSTAQSTATEFIYTPEFVPDGIESIAFRVNGSAFTGTTTMYIDDVVWEELPVCADVIETEIANIGTTTADITWTPSGSETAWQYVYAVSTITDPSTLTPEDITNNPFLTLTGLQSSTNYNLWIRSNCGSGLFGNWSAVINFTTACAPVSELPWTEGFEGITTVGTNAFPPCWLEENGDWASALVSTYNTPKSGTKYIRNSWTATNEYMWTPGFELTAGTSYDFSFYMQGDGFTGWNVDIFHNSVQNSVDAIQLGETITAAGSGTIAVQPYALVSNTFIPTTSGVYYFAIRVNQASGTPWYIAFDDFKMEVTPTCIAPTTQATNAITTTTASVNWTSPEVPANGYEYFLTTDSAVVPNATTVATGTISGTNSTFGLTTLTPATTYYFYIRSLCSASDISSWSGAATFKTACSEVTDFSENFDSYTATGAANPLPDCWLRAGNGNTYIATGGVAPGTPPNRLYMNASGTATIPTVGYAIMPPVSNLQADTHRLKFKAYASTTGKYLEIGYLTNIADLTSFVLVETVDLPGTTAATAQTFIINPANIPAGINSLAFRNPGTPTASTTAYIDDVVWEVKPLCPEITSVVFAGSTSDSAIITWTQADSETSWEYVYDLATVTDPSGLTPFAVTGNPETIITGLLSSTTYKVWVRANCGTNSGVYSSPITFTTTCEALETLPWNESFEDITTVGTSAFPSCWFKENGDWASAVTGTYNTPRTGTKYIRNSWAATNEFMWTPGFEMTAGTSYDFSFYMQGDGATGWNVDVFYNTVQFSTDATQLGSTSTPSGSGSIAMQPYQLVNNTFVPTTSGVYYFAIRVNQPSTSPWYIAFDDFKIELTPTCVAPSGLTVPMASVTTTTAVANWTASTTVPANGYEYYYTTDATPPTASTTPSGSVAAGITTANIAGLTISTTYRLYVRAVCGANDSSAWTPAVVFTTLCESVQLPYSIDFESVTVPNLPLCTSNQNVGTGNNWVTANNPGSGFTDKTLRYTYNSTNPANTWFFTNSVSLVAGMQYSISYKYGTNSTIYVEKMKIAYGANADNTAMTNLLVDHNNITGTTPQNNTITFTPAVSGTYVFGFNAYSDTDQNGLFVDNIVIEEFLGTVDFNNNKFTVYPNPVKDNLNIRYNENISNVSVFNMLGQQVITKNINATEGKVDMSILASGTYLVKVNSGDKVETIKVIKE